MSSLSSIHTFFFFFFFFFFFVCLPTLSSAQQPYASTNCANKNANTSSFLGYSCNGLKRSCQAYLIYRAQPPYTNISAISALLAANTTAVSSINNASATAPLPTNWEVIVPVTCSCAGRYYQSNASYLVKAGDTPYLIGNNTYEGLTSCNSIQNNKLSHNVVDIFPNQRLTIPLRCACPTRNQTRKGIKYLMSFVAQDGNGYADIAIKFGADVGETFEANEKTEQDPKIYPFTTVLVPLRTPPNGSQIMFPPPVSTLPPSPPPPPSASVSPSAADSNRKWTFFGYGIIAGGGSVLLVGIILLLILIRRKPKRKTDPIVSSEKFEAVENPLMKRSKVEVEPREFLESISSIASMKVYSFKDLQTATDNFSASFWVKGSVVRGTLDGQQVAIKKVNGDVTKEINLLNKINHFNLISLLGVCFDDSIWYLVYEYAANGPLSNWIYHNNADQKFLSWAQRMQIASDVAAGLNYLHSYTSPPHVHKDIKSNNVLLDSDFRAKIAKLGLSRPVGGHNGQFTLTKHIVGTKGYLAPEYLENGLVSPKLDVYAFGVLMLEILTGKEVALLHERVSVHLSEILGPVLTEEDGKEKLKEFIDPTLQENFPADVAMSMVILSNQCLRKEPGSRPSMDDIVQVLSRTLTTSLMWESTSSFSGYE